MIEIDGEYGSGGGQVLRTAVGLSALTGKPCRVTNVRAKRANPGLREQHLQAIRAVAAFCNGTVKGASIGSPEIQFRPGETVSEKVQVNIGTAGSVGLVLQALLLPATARGLNVSISGGATYGKWAVPVSYLQTVLCPILGRAGYQMAVRVEKEGFYPKGGAAVRTTAVASGISPIEISDKGELIAVRGVSVASSSLKRAQVADRQAQSAGKLLSAHFGVEPEIKCVTPTPSVQGPEYSSGRRQRIRSSAAMRSANGANGRKMWARRPPRCSSRSSKAARWTVEPPTSFCHTWLWRAAR